jgi:beta-lactam-binding protein with PASTA domain
MTFGGSHMQQQRKARQRGISFFGLIVVMIVLALVGLVGAQVLPTAIEYQAILKAVNKAKDGGTVHEVRQIFDKAADIDNITSIRSKDLTISKNGDQVVVAFAYDKEIPLAGPAYLLIKYRGQSRQTR